MQRASPASVFVGSDGGLQEVGDFSEASVATGFLGDSVSACLSKTAGWHSRASRLDLNESEIIALRDRSAQTA